jgi:hypothetical protein
VSLSNDLWERGYWRTATLIKDMVESRYGKLPYVGGKIQYYDLAGRLSISAPTIIGWYRSHVNHHAYNRNSKLPRRFNSRLQRVEYKVWLIKPKVFTFRVDGWRECLRRLTCGGVKSSSIRSTRDTGFTTGVYTLPHRVCLHRGWAAD